ncbi:MAG: TIGR04063 family PEP-CTERM/XrtA system glycosyltransferase [Desulfosoma sp.]
MGADTSFRAFRGCIFSEFPRTVLHVLDHSLPVQTGYTYRSRNILRCLRNVGFEPIVLTSPKHEESAPSALTSSEIYDSVCYFRSGKIKKVSPFLYEWRIMGRMRRELDRLVKSRRPAILHVHSPVLNAFPAFAIGRRYGIPVVYEIRAFWEDAAVDHGTHREWGFRYRLIRALETLACRTADAVVTICEGLRSDLLARGIPSTKITVVPNAIDPAELQSLPRDEALRARWGFRPNDFVVAFIGSFYHYEGLDLLFRAFTQFPIKGSQIRALLIGGGPEEDALRCLARELDVEGVVNFAGRIPHNEVPAAYAACDALVLPRKSMRLTELVTPLKPLEAMAMGVAVIASDVGGHKELIRDGETGLLFRAGSSQALAEKIFTLFSKPDLSAFLTQEAKRWVYSNRTWQHNAHLYFNLYQKLLSDGASLKRKMAAL